MAKTKLNEADTKTMMRALGREAMKSGFEIGYDRATKLVERISEAWGESQTMAVELKKMRAKILQDAAADIEKETEAA